MSNLYHCYGKYKVLFYLGPHKNFYIKQNITEQDFMTYDFDFRLVRNNKTECSITISDMYNKLALYRDGQWTHNIVLEIHVEYIKSY